MHRGIFEIRIMTGIFVIFSNLQCATIEPVITENYYFTCDVFCMKDWDLNDMNYQRFVDDGCVCYVGVKVDI